MSKQKSKLQTYQRPFKLSHQVLCVTSINFARKALMGYVELLVQPRRPDLKTIKVNSKQSRICKVCVNDIEATFQYHDPSLDLTQRDPDARNLEFLRNCHSAAVDIVDPDTGYHGEVTIRLPQEVMKIVKEQKPLRVCMDFTLEDPKGGLQFVVPDVEGTSAEKAMHLFTYGYENSARLWFPCIDTYSELCTWKLEFTVDVTMTAVSVGELVETVYTPDKKRKTFHYILTVPTSAPNIGLAVGPFNIIVDKHMHEVTHFCLPQLQPLLDHTTQTCYEMFEFFEEILGFPFPYSCYKQVFVDEAYAEVTQYASLGIFSTNLLHSKAILDQTPRTRRQMAKMISDQFFGCFMARESWNDLWLPLGISAYLHGLWIKHTFGNNEYKYWISSETSALCDYETNVQPVTLCFSEDADFSDPANRSQRNPHTMSPKCYEMVERKSHLVLRIIEQCVGPHLLLQAFNKLLCLANTSAQQKVPNSTWVQMLLSTESFLKSINTVSGKNIDHLMDRWVYRNGVVNFFGRFTFNRKRNAVELEVKQEVDGKGIKRYVGPLTIRIQELDGPFTHTIQIEENNTKHDIQCHSKARRNKKKKIPLLNGEETDIDLSAMDPDSPVLWLRIDPDVSIIRTVNFEQPDYMWQYQVKFERDICGQSEALSILPHYPSPATRKAVTDVLENEKYFYRVRMEAAYSMTRIANSMVSSWAGPPAMLNLFTRLFFCESNPPIVRMNNFSNLQQYFIQKTLPMAMSKLRDGNATCPKEVLHFIIDLIKFNDNTRNKVSDNYYRSSLLDALSNAITPAMTATGQKVTLESLSPDTRLILEELTRFLNLEKLLPSYRFTVTASALRALRKLQKTGHLPPDAPLLRSYAVYGFFIDIRLAAIESLVDMLSSSNIPEEFDWLLDLCINDPLPEVKWKVLKGLTANPPFTKSDTSSPLNTAYFVEKLWTLITKTTFYDSRMRCEAIDLYGILFGTSRPRCLPAKEKKSLYSITSHQSDGRSSYQSTQNKLKRTASTTLSGNSQDELKMRIKFQSASVDEPETGLDNADVIAAQSLLSLSNSEIPSRPATPGADHTSNQGDPSSRAGAGNRDASADRNRHTGEIGFGGKEKRKKKKHHKHKHKHKHREGEWSSPASSYVDSPMAFANPDSPKAM